MKNDVKQHLQIKMFLDKFIFWKDNDNNYLHSDYGLIKHFVCIRSLLELPMEEQDEWLEVYAKSLFMTECTTNLAPRHKVRKLTLNEYLLVSKLISSLNKKFNKKKNILI